MSELHPNDPVPPVGIIQPCSEACAGFQKLSTGGWSDYGLCTNPRSPYRGSPVHLGQECRDFQPTGDRLHPRQA